MWGYGYRGWLAAVGAFAVTLAAQPGEAADQAPPPLFTRASTSPPGGSFWIEASYLYWSAKGDRLPALVTQGGTGVLGAPGTVVAFGDSDVNGGWRSGARVRLGYWFDPAKRSGVDAHFFMLDRSATDFAASSDGSTLLARPFFNTNIGAQDASFIASPGLLSGQISINDTSRLYGAGAAYRTEICANCAMGSVNGFVGYRYLHLRDKLQIASTSVGAGNFAGFTFTTSEAFATTNHFHGLDLGLNGEIRQGPWSLEWLAKVAVGATFNELSINGSSGVTTGGVTTVTAGGLLAQPTNIGDFSRTRLAAVPEFSAKLGYQITPAIRVFAGYDVMYWTGVVRPGGAIDTTVNVTQIGGGALVGAARPAPQFDTSNYWAHGANFGIKAAF